MEEKYLVINAGSSSLKFSLYNMPNNIELINGNVEKIGYQDSSYTLKMNGQKIEKEEVINNHKEAVKVMMRELLKTVISNTAEIKGVGHRILHGGEIYKDSVIIDNTVLEDIKSLSKLGPLHHPGEIAGILAMQEILPNVPEVAVFDTAFHHTIPDYNHIYPVPYDWYKKYSVRKYGFHGTSHKYITEDMQKKLNKNDVNLIICHIGSGASISAIKNGVCFDTSMGLTPLDGLMMGTRCGAIDPSIIEYVSKSSGMNVEKITDMLNTESGLIGICGKNDFRDVEKLINEDNYNAKLAFEMLKKSIMKYISEYYFELNGKIDAIVFTAGLGENVSILRRDIVKMLEPLNIHLNEKINDSIAKFKTLQTGIITTSNSSIPVYVIPTNEEIMILKDTYSLIKENNKTLTKKMYD